MTRAIALALRNGTRYHATMIRSFGNKETAKVFDRRRSQRLSPSLQRLALRRLLVLDAAERLDDLRVPAGNRLEKLSGNRRGQYSIRINNQWRLCFRWRSGHAYDAAIVDYH